MKQGKCLLFLLALVLVLSMSVSTAYAYFTASVTPKGGYVLKIGYTPPINEDVAGDKTVWITSKTGSPTVFVRAKAFTGAQFQQALRYSAEDEYWRDGLPGSDPDGYWYYMKPLEGGSSTSKLYVQVHVTSEQFPDGVFPDGVQPGDQINVIVVYESTPAVFKEDGDPDFTTAWANYSAPVQQQQGG